MNKSMLSAVSVLVLSVSSLTAVAQTTQVMSGSNPRPQVMSGSNPRPQVMSGSNPRPQSTMGTAVSAILSFFGIYTF